MHSVRTACRGVLRVWPFSFSWFDFPYRDQRTVSCKKYVTCCTQCFNQRYIFRFLNLRVPGTETKASDNTETVRGIHLHVHLYLLLPPLTSLIYSPMIFHQDHLLLQVRMTFCRDFLFTFGQNKLERLCAADAVLYGAKRPEQKHFCRWFFKYMAWITIFGKKYDEWNIYMYKKW